MRLTFLLSIVLLCGCQPMESTSSQKTEITTYAECAAFVSTKINLNSTPPAKVRILWNGGVQIDECTGLKRGQLERGANWLRDLDGGFGYTAPSTVSIEVQDLGDCSGPTATIFSVTDAVVSTHQPQLCEPFDLEFNQ